jgi:hypothetical protein
VGAGVREALRICHDELRLCAFVIDVPLSSRSRRRMRFSLLSFPPRVTAVELEGDLEAALLELVEGFCGARWCGCVEEAVGEPPGGERADRHVVVRSEGSSSEKM